MQTLRGKKSEGEKSKEEQPEEMRQMIERVSYGPYLEMFARRSAPGWDHWGNEMNTDVEIFSS